MATHEEYHAPDATKIAIKNALVQAYKHVIQKTNAYAQAKATNNVAELSKSPAYWKRVTSTSDSLRDRRITLPTDSPLQLNGEPMAGKQISLEQCILANDWILPQNLADIQNLANALSRPPLQSAPYGNFGGGLSWSAPPLSQEMKKNILASVRNNAIALDEFEYLRRSKDALGYLTQSRQWSPEELSDPRAFLTNLLNTPEAYALGKALQTQFKGAPSATSINDWAMTAIAIGIEAKSILDPDNSTNKVAGFDLSSLDLGGKPLREVVKALTEHLANPETPAADFAPVRAYALLARHAPELLVKEVPESVTYGSPSWISLKAAVARIEAQAPGQALSMNYGKIMQYANISPITAAEKQVEQQASLQAMMYWAINEGILKKNDNNRYTAAQVEHVRGKAKERFIALEKASSAKDTELLTREDMAVKILKEKFGEGIDFKKKCIIPIENWNHLKGPYSVIDLVLSGELSRGIFRSFDTTIPVDTIARSRHEIPDIQEAFKKSFSHYYEGKKNATSTAVRHLISQLPLKDRERLEFGAIKVYEQHNATSSISNLGLNGFGDTTPGRYGVQRSLDENHLGLMIETRYDGKTYHYEINPPQGFIRPITHFKPGLQGEWTKLPPKDNNSFSNYTTYSNKEINEVHAKSDAERRQRESTRKTDEPLQSFNSSRTQYIAQLMANKFFPNDSRNLFEQTQGLTTLDTEVTDFEKIQNFTRIIVPFASAIHSFSKGHTRDGVESLVLDIFGFLFVGAKAAGGIAKVAGQAGSFASKIQKGANILSRAVASGANPFSGGRALFSGTVKLVNTGASLANQGFQFLRRGANSADLLSPIKRTDVIEGSIKTTNNADPLKVIAKRDDSGVLYAYDPKTENLFGPPLKNFQPDNTFSTLQTNAQKLPVPAPVKPALPAHTSQPVDIFMGNSQTLNQGNESILTTRSLTDCSAIAVLTDWDGKVYRTRTLMHLSGSNVEHGLIGEDASKLLSSLDGSLNRGGKVILVAGIDSHSTVGMGIIIGQTTNNQRPLMSLLKDREGVSVTVASSLGVSIYPDGTFKLIEDTGKGVFTKEMLKPVYDFID
ncbi:hypothetical protein [Pseudomonas weihenstephanensis]|uniref:hypothetical protein n=1 Tax=Pseudomonas weihenstephanensis TaxID=1608994 RepID=UPI00193C524F|nr:hypothetical protein [Pseudomonas weihenstephanensis]MBM1192263.1 hypothetical protein [Pseudomonas weihenstephanensis]